MLFNPTHIGLLLSCMGGGTFNHVSIWPYYKFMGKYIYEQIYIIETLAIVMTKAVLNRVILLFKQCRAETLFCNFCVAWQNTPSPNMSRIKNFFSYISFSELPGLS